MSRYKQGHAQYTQLIKDTFVGDPRITNVSVGLNDETRLFLSLHYHSFDMNACWSYVQLRMPKRTRLVRVTFSPPSDEGGIRASFLVDFDVTP